MAALKNQDSSQKPTGTGSIPARRLATDLLLLHGRSCGGAEVRGSFYGLDAGGVHGRVFVLSGALPAGDDRAGVAHASSGRGGLSGDETDDGLLHVGFDPFGCGLFGVA